MYSIREIFFIVFISLFVSFVLGCPQAFDLVDSSQEKQISIREITGVFTPTQFYEPPSRVTETDEFTGTIKWIPNDEFFFAGTKYKAEIELIPKQGYTLTGVPRDYFFVDGATVTHAANPIIISAEFPQTKPLTINGKTPEEGVAIASTLPVFSWREIDRAESYEIQIVETENDWESVDTNIVTEPTYTPDTALRNNHTHFWRVRAVDSNDQRTEWSRGYSLSIGWGAISGKIPNDEANIANTRPELAWDAVGGAKEYELQISDSDGDWESIDTIIVTEPTYTPDTALRNNHTHFWRVRAVDSNDQRTGWSRRYSLSIGWGAISGKIPNDEANIANTRPELTWDAVGGAKEYELQISDSDGDWESVDTNIVTEPTYTPDTALRNNHTHFWRVRAVDRDDQTSVWSEIQSLRIEWGEIGGKIPYDEALVANTSPEFMWDAVGEAREYELQISDSSSDWESVETIIAIGPSYSPVKGLRNNHTHFWRVRAVDRDDQTSVWSETQSLRIEWGEIGGKSPFDGTVTTDIRPIISWSHVPGASVYEVQIAGSEVAVMDVEPISTSDLEQVFPYDLERGSRGYWRVRAKDTLGMYGDWSTISSVYKRFAIGDTGPAGGWIFYIDNDNNFDWTYLEAAPSETEKSLTWGGGGSSGDLVGEWGPTQWGLPRSIGSGMANTQAIVAAYQDNEPYANLTEYAAKYANDLSHNGFDDWFLPSRDELTQLYRRCCQTNRLSWEFGEEFSSPAGHLYTYWSSSETNATNAWVVGFSTRQPGYDGHHIGKQSVSRVRAIRRF